MASLRSRSSTYPDLSGKLSSAELLKRLKVSGVTAHSEHSLYFFLFKILHHSSLPWGAGLLQSCAHLLTSIDQGKDDQSSKTPELEKVANALVRPEIIFHLDRGVRLVAACCLSDILRIFAPDAPYTSSQLKVRN